MDPASAFGIASGALQTVQIIGATIQGLWTIHGKYNEADLTIHSLIVELSTIKSALSQLHEWAHRDSHGFLNHPDYLHSLDVSVGGCKAIMEVFSDEVTNLVSGIAHDEESLRGTLGFRARMKIIWNDELMNDHHQRLHAQVLALQLLLQVCQWSVDPLLFLVIKLIICSRTSSEQLELLRREDSLRLIKKVAHDNATLRSSMSTASSFQSGRSPSTGDTEFLFDNTVVDSTAYRRVMNQHMRSRSDGNTRNQDDPVSRRPSQRTLRTDEGYGSGTLPSVDRLQVPSPNPGTSPVARYAPSPEDVYRSHTTALERSSSAAYQNLGRSQSASVSSPLKASGSKRDKVRSMISRVNSTGRTSLGSSSSFTSLPSRSDTRPFKINRKSEPNISIDLSSPSGVTAPPIIKAAQSGVFAQVDIQIANGTNIEIRHDETGRTALAVAAHCGKEDVTSLLLQSNAKANTQDGTLMTPLHLAASRGYTGVVKLLLGEDVDIDGRDSKGRTPFWIAADAGYIETARLLLDCGCKVNSRATDQMTALHTAAKRGDLETVTFLLRGRIDIHAKDTKLQTALHHACKSGHVEVARQLISSGAKIEAIGEQQATPLICAAAKGQWSIAYLLLKKGALIGSVDENGMNALHRASENGHVDVVELLVKKKASMTATTKRGLNALHVASKKKEFAVVEFLLREKARAEVKCSSGLTAFHYACRAGSAEIVRLFLACGAKIDDPIKVSERSPAHLAVEAGSSEIIQCFIKRRAKMDCIDRLGHRPLTLACGTGNVEIVQLLLNSGDTPILYFERFTHGVSPICVAAAGGHSEIVTILANAGASPSECDEKGWNALLNAAHYGKFDVLELLLAKCDIPAKQTLVSSFFNIGFAPNMHIPDEVKRNVSDLVIDTSNDPRLRLPTTFSQWAPQELASTPAAPLYLQYKKRFPTVVLPDQSAGASQDQNQHQHQQSIPERPRPTRPPKEISMPSGQHKPNPQIHTAIPSSTPDAPEPALSPIATSATARFSAPAAPPTLPYEPSLGLRVGDDPSHHPLDEPRSESSPRSSSTIAQRPVPGSSHQSNDGIQTPDRDNTNSHANPNTTTSVEAENERTPAIASALFVRNKWDERLQSNTPADDESDADSVATFDTAIEEVGVYELEG